MDNQSRCPDSTCTQANSGGDPLVIGRKDNAFWLLTKFDTTASEQYAACTFTQSPK